MLYNSVGYIEFNKGVSDDKTDSRQQGKVSCDLLSMLRQRVSGLALGYEDLNDHNTLRDGLALQTAVETDDALASAATFAVWETKRAVKPNQGAAARPFRRPHQRSQMVGQSIPSLQLGLKEKDFLFLQT